MTISPSFLPSVFVIPSSNPSLSLTRYKCVAVLVQLGTEEHFTPERHISHTPVSVFNGNLTRTHTCAPKISSEERNESKMHDICVECLYKVSKEGSTEIFALNVHFAEGIDLHNETLSLSAGKNLHEQDLRN